MALPDDFDNRPVGLAPLPLTGTPGSCSRFELARVGWEFYDGVMHALGFPPDFPDGHVCQFTGPLDDDTWFMANGWLSRDHSEDFFRDVAMPVVQRKLAESDVRPDIEPDTLSVDSLVLGPDALRFCIEDEDVDGAAVRAYGHAPVLLASGEESIPRDEYDSILASLGLPETVPPGMIAQMRGTAGEGEWFAYDVWRDLDVAIATAPEIATTARRVPMRRIAINRHFVHTPPDDRGPG